MSLSRHEAYMARRAARLAAREAAEAGQDTAPADARVSQEQEDDPALTFELELELPVLPEPETGAETEAEPEPEPEPVTEPEPEPETGPGAAPAVVQAGRSWDALRRLTLDSRHLTRNRLISATREDPAHVAFDVLRTKLIATLRAQGWSRVAITSATPACGKSFVAANLAISLSRKPGLRTLLVDADLRRPSLAKLFGAKVPGAIADLLTGRTPPEAHLLRPAANDLNIGENLALAFNDRVETYAAEILQAPATTGALARIYALLAPDVVIFDMPPALYHDDVIAFRSQFDGVMVVVAGGHSTAREVLDLKDRLGSDIPLLGVIMNRAEGEDITRYEY